MPNWSYAEIEITADTNNPDAARQLLDFVARLRATGSERSDGVVVVSLTEAFYPMPMPEKYEGTVSGSPSVTVTADDGLTWYEWANRNWGTKWGDCQTVITNVSDDRVAISTRFAWAPGWGLLRRLSGIAPALRFSMEWDDDYDGAWYVSKWQGNEDPVTTPGPGCR
ncbi:MAG: hypothetical protein AAF531_23830 [Actinomycetota bacterium]